MKSTLNNLQNDFLREFFSRENHFYLTGGAALVGFYFGHRKTEDLDLFTLENEIENGFAIARDAAKVVEELKERFQKQQADGLEIAHVYGGLGERDQAFVWLQKEFQSRNQKLTNWLAVGYFDSLRNDPRYKDLLKRMGLPE